MLEKKRSWFTSFDLKILALILMTLDHIGYFLGSPGLLNTPFYFRLLGRISAPLFIFCMAQGFFYTRSKMAYLLRLYAASVLMYFANGLVEQVLPHPEGAAIINGIFGTMFLIGVYCWGFLQLAAGIREKKAGKILLSLCVLLLPLLADALKLAMIAKPSLLGESGMLVLRLACGLLPSPLLAEGSFFWVLLGVGAYFLRDKKFVFSIFYIAISGFFFLTALPEGMNFENLFFINYQWFMIFTLPLLLCYNGQRGRGMKYLFYFYYPGHIYVLAALAYGIGRIS